MNKLMLYFFIFSLSLFAEDKNEFTKINTFKAVIIENSHLNKRKKTKEYQVLASLPDKLIKKMISPSINQGEIYLYNGSNKTIYYPLLEQIIDQKINKDENYTLKFIRDLKSLDENVDFKVVKSNDKIQKIIYNDGITIKFESFSKKNGINFPTHVRILDDNIEVSELIIKDIEINIPVSEKDFSLDEIIKN
jgi:outer membrane lipoprotein-sorting protein